MAAGSGHRNERLHTYHAKSDRRATPELTSTTRAPTSDSAPEGRTGSDAAQAADRIPAELMVFDILELDGTRMRSRPYDERRSQLAETVDENEFVQVPPAFDGSLDDGIADSKYRGLEGVVAKRRNSI